MRIVLLLVTLVLTTTAAAQQRAPLSPLGEKIQAAMQSEIRSEADRMRDRNRKPIETLEFLGLKDDMTVIEFFPGGGWYTRILGPVLRDKGQLYLAIGASRVDLSHKSMNKVEVLDVDAELKPAPGFGVFDITDFSFPVNNVDMVLTFRNLHNLTAESRARVNKAVYAALRPGGIYGVVDHTRRHMQKQDPENTRRIDPVLVIKEVQAAGFKFADFSDLHYRADDELRYEVGRRSVTGNSDRFTFRFVKPE